MTGIELIAKDKQENDMTEMQLLEETSRTGDAFIKALYAAKDSGIIMDDPDTDIVLRDTYLSPRPRHSEPNKFIRPCQDCGETYASIRCYREESGNIIWLLTCQECGGRMIEGGSIIECVNKWNGTEC